MTRTSIEEDLLTLERRYWEGLKDGDLPAVLDLTDDPCIVTGAQGLGRISHEQYRAMMTNANWTIERFAIGDDATVRLLDNDTAIVAYTVHEDLTVDGEPVSLDAADASTWVRRDGHWRCALHTEAIAGDPFGRDRSTNA